MPTLSQVLFGLHQVGLRFGGTIVIQGAGGLGVQAAAVAKDMGAATIIVVDQVAERRQSRRRSARTTRSTSRRSRSARTASRSSAS